MKKNDEIIDNGYMANVTYSSTIQYKTSMFQYSKLLLVEDDIDDQQIFLSILADIGFAASVNIARNGNEALHIVRQVLPDLIITDINMPLLSGEGLLAELQQMIFPAPVVIHSTSMVHEAIWKQRGASFCFVKPDTLIAYRTILTEVLSRKF